MNLALRPGRQYERAAVEATWVGELAVTRLIATASIPGIVHSVFGKAINVTCSRGMVSFVPDGAARGPMNVNLRLDEKKQKSTLASFDVHPRNTLTMSGTFLDIGEGRLVVSLGKARTYVSERDFQRPVLDTRGIDENLHAARVTALELGRRGGLGELIPLVEDGAVNPSSSIRLNIFALESLQGLQALLSAIAAGDSRGIRRAVRELAGIGPGLTPSSDDLLAGLMLVMRLYARNARTHEERVETLTRSMLSGAVGRTTSLSEEYLSQAYLGRGGEDVTGLCRELLTGNPESVDREARRVLSIGATSGTDTMFGIMLGTQLILNILV